MKKRNFILMFFVLFCTSVFASCTPHEIKYSGNGSTNPTDYKYVAEVFVYPNPYYSLVSSNNLSATDSFTIMCGNLDTLKGFLANQFIDYGTYIDSNLMFKYTIYVEGLEHNNNSYYKTDYIVLYKTNKDIEYIETYINNRVCNDIYRAIKQFGNNNNQITQVFIKNDVNSQEILYKDKNNKTLIWDETKLDFVYI